MAEKSITKHVTTVDLFGAPDKRDEILDRIRSDQGAWQEFSSLSDKDQDRILGFLSGDRGLQILCDRFFQKVLNPAETPERVESLISAIYDQPVKIVEVLPREGTMISDTGSQVVMDIIVKLASGATVNVEMQRIGFLFPGERSSCYLADMIMRQYNKVREERGKDFTYRDMKPVNLIILMDHSSREFRDVAPQYIHRQRITYSSGVQVTSLEQITYVSLDNYRERTDNNYGTMLDAWLTFFTSEDPAVITQLATKYPEFLPMYQDITEFRKKPGEVIGMFSEALRIMDRNTTKYMIDEMKQQVIDLQQEVVYLQQEAADKQEALDASEKAHRDKDQLIEELQETIRQLTARLDNSASDQ